MKPNRVENEGRKERRVGAACGLFYAVANLSSRLLLVPIMLHYLDRSEFGLYQLIGAFVGYLALVDFGISGSISRFIAKCQVTNDLIRQSNVLAMCVIIYSFLGVLIAVIGVLMYNNLDTLFSTSLTPSEMAAAKVMFMVLVASTSVTVLAQAFAGVSAGHERFIVPRLINSLCMLAKVGVVAAVLALGHRAIGIVAAEAFINFIVLALNAGYACMVLKVRFKLHFWDWTLFKDMLGFAFWTFLAALVLQINFRLGCILLGTLTTTGLVAVYAIALQINTLYNMLPTTISSVFLPRITRLVVETADGEQLTRAIISPSRYQLMLMGCVLSSFVLFGKQFIALWAGPDYVEAWSVALLILIPVTIPLCQNTVLSILYAKMLNRARALITLCFALLSGIGAFFLIDLYGLYGPAVATGLALLIGHGVVMNLYYHYRVGLDMPLFFKKVCSRILWVILLVILSGSMILYLPLGAGWLGLSIRLNLFVMLYLCCMWFFAMNAGEKSLVRSAVCTGIRLLPPLSLHVKPK